jgi:hypothetical protein
MSRQESQSLKKVMAVGTVELATEHATILEIYVLISTGTDRYGPTSRRVLFRRQARAALV